jgi:hypothetical protein
MRGALRRFLVAVIVVGASAAASGGVARAQDPGLGGVLGGYGAMTGTSAASMGGGTSIVDPSGMGGNVVVPVARGSVPAMSPSMRGAGLSFRSRSSAALYSARPSFTLDSMRRGMPGMAGGMSTRRPFELQSGTFTGGMGLGGGMRRGPASKGMGVMPPRIGSPFRQPPSLVTPAGPGAGMSM